MKKRVCFLADSVFTIGGVQRVTAVIAKALATDYDVTIMTFDQPNTTDLSLYDLDDNSLTIRFFSYPKAGRIENALCKAYSALYLKLQLQSAWSSRLYGLSSFPPTLRKALTRELQDGHYDVIIGVHAPLAARLATIRKELPGTRMIGWIHNSFEALYGKKYLYIGSLRRRHYMYQFRRLDRLVLLCRQDVSAYTAYDPQLSPTYIYNPLTLKPGPLSDGTSRRFLAIGRFSYQHKGFDLLIEAFHLFAQHDKVWSLDIVGEGPEEAAYRRLISKYQLEDRVRIHPFTHDIQPYYAQAQVYVLSSRWEGMPLVLVEAMSHGLPVVTSSLPVCKEILGDFAIYFNSGDINSLSQRLEDATNIDWPEKSRQALQIARQFQLDNIRPQWNALINETSLPVKKV